MKSAARILITAILGATIITVLALTVDLRADAPPATSLLRGALPSMDPEPPNPHVRYSSAWWIAEDAVQVWKEKYGTAVILVIPAAASKPVYALDGQGAATAVQVMPQWRLTLFAAAIERGEAVWCPLSDALATLQGAALPAAPSPGIDRIQQQNARLRNAIADAILTLSSVE